MITWFDIIIIIITIYCIIKGYKSGLVKQLATLLGLVAGAMLSGQISEIILPFLEQKLNTTSYLLSPISYLLSFGIIMVCFYFLSTLAEGILETIKMGKLNRIAGALFCIAKWFFAISIVINIISMFDKNQTFIKNNTIAHSISYKYIQPLAPHIIPFIEKHLRIDNIPF